LKKLKTVDEQFNSQSNLNKFCLPVTITTARQLEQAFDKERLKKDLVAQAQASKKPPGKTSKQASTNKQQHDKLKQVANDKYGTDERFKGKFVEMAMKL
jgi:hypothetical protein